MYFYRYWIEDIILLYAQQAEYNFMNMLIHKVARQEWYYIK